MAELVDFALHVVDAIIFRERLFLHEDEVVRQAQDLLVELLDEPLAVLQVFLHFAQNLVRLRLAFFDLAILVVRFEHFFMARWTRRSDGVFQLFVLVLQVFNAYVAITHVLLETQKLLVFVGERLVEHLQLFSQCRHRVLNGLSLLRLLLADHMLIFDTAVVAHRARIGDHLTRSSSGRVSAANAE